MFHFSIKNLDIFFDYLFAFTNLCIYFTSEVRKINSTNNLPSWHRKSQKAYKVNRVIIILQIVAALVMCGVVLYGMNRFMQ